MFSVTPLKKKKQKAPDLQTGKYLKRIALESSVSLFLENLLDVCAELV
jgi:hypothetical protein